MGVGEIILIPVALGIIAAIAYGTIYGAYKAFTTGRTGWGIAIIAGWLFAVGWIIGWVFLLGPGRNQPAEGPTPT